GGRDYDESVFNRATQAKRQPGSAFKPFVYLAALESGISPWETRTDNEVNIDGWSPTNYGGREWGTITLASALAHSVNTITAALGQEVGIDKVIDAAERLGIKSHLDPNPSITLGTSEVTPLELTTAYAAFANGGMRVQPYLVTEVNDPSGRVLYRRQPPSAERVIADNVDRDMVAMLYGVVQEGTGRSAAISGHEAAGKTGTTQDYRDAWFVGFTTDYVTTVWIGNDNNKPMREVTGGTIPSEVWKAVMTSAEDGLPAKPLNKSEPQAPIENNGVVTAENGSATVENDGEGAASADEESGGAKIEDDSDSAANSDTGDDQGSSSGKHGRGGGLWDWLFGKDQAAKEASRKTVSPEDDSGSNPPPHVSSTTPSRRDLAPAPHSLGTLPANDDGAGSDTAPAHDMGSRRAPPPRVVRPANDEPPPPPPRAGPPPPPPPDVEDEGAQHPDGGEDDSPQ
ncbi:MAG: hypothetical protein JOY77_08035, partial [Alphaproteobacteria bacterium]|nr:hypothetical protein [Alphaproteobacteria bacterium]